MFTADVLELLKSTEEVTSKLVDSGGANNNFQMHEVIEAGYKPVLTDLKTVTSSHLEGRTTLTQTHNHKHTHTEKAL